MADYDAIIIGAGHNGLTCAAYLGKAGLRVKVLERRAVVGGAAVTEEFHPGFRNSVASYTVSLLNPKIIRDLDLARARPDASSSGARKIFCHARMAAICSSATGRTRAEIAKFQRARRRTLSTPLNGELDACADVLRELVLRAPPNPAARGPQLLADMMTMRPADAARCAASTHPTGAMLHDLFTQVGRRISRQLV